MGPGESFGEWALISNEPRKASVFAEEDTHFLIISKEDYAENLAKIEKAETEKLIEFIRQIPYMQKFPDQLIVKLKPHFKTVYHGRRGNKVIT